ncbi:MAG: sulfotransferase domain-containing protein [Acidimicrobiales bacterium]
MSADPRSDPASARAGAKARARSQVRALSRLPGYRLRLATPGRRPLPSFVIIGAQRAGTTSVYEWICSQPGAMAAVRKEIHYFDVNYDRGENWYKSHFRAGRPGMATGEASPYMLFHPLSPERAARDLDGATRYVALLREPVARAVSQYWHEYAAGHEHEPFDRAIALEAERLQGSHDVVLRGEGHYSHQHHSYAARGEYASQLRRWFEAVGRDRLLVVESEQVLRDPVAAGEVLEWLGLPASSSSLPVLNGAARASDAPSSTIDSLRGHFARHNNELFELLGREMWV